VLQPYRPSLFSCMISREADGVTFKKF
jgi:hypothetical protein